jgi:hypothetical protein
VDDIGSYDVAREILEKRRRHYVMTGNRGAIAALEQEIPERERELEDCRRKEEALQLLYRAMELHPQDETLLCEIALVMEKMGLDGKERAAYLEGGGEYYAPVMTMGDFLDGKRGSEPFRVLPSYRNGLVRVADFSKVFPDFVTESLRYGLRSFGKKVQGYDARDAILTAAETRTSAPLRILRDSETLTALGHHRIYPCGEGAGYAGGITSAAVDGIRSALAFMARFAPWD